MTQPPAGAHRERRNGPSEARTAVHASKYVLTWTAKHVTARWRDDVAVKYGNSAGGPMI